MNEISNGWEDCGSFTKGKIVVVVTKSTRGRNPIFSMKVCVRDDMERVAPYIHVRRRGYGDEIINSVADDIRDAVAQAEAFITAEYTKQNDEAYVRDIPTKPATSVRRPGKTAKDNAKKKAKLLDGSAKAHS